MTPSPSPAAGWLERALPLTEPVGITQFIQSAARAGCFALAEKVLASLVGLTGDMPRIFLAAARYDVEGLSSVSVQLPPTEVVGPLRRAARHGRVEDVRVLVPRVPHELACSCVWEMKPNAMDDAALRVALHWAIESAIPLLRIAEEAVRRGRVVEVFPLATAVPAWRSKVQYAIARGLGARGYLRDVVEFAETVPELREDLVAAAADLALQNEPAHVEQWLTHVRRPKLKRRVANAATRGRARRGDPGCLEEARSLTGGAQVEHLLSTFSGYMTGGHLALAEACIPLTESSQLTLRKGLVAAAAAVAGDSSVQARMLSGLKGSAHEDVGDTVVRALGLARRFDDAEQFARDQKLRSGSAAPIVAWGRARENEFEAVEAIVTWAAPKARSWTLQAAAVGASGVELWREPYP
jgi:hypothetical protein